MCWGELLWDLFPDGPRLGGTAANLAYHAAQLGARALLVSRVGDDELGRRALHELEQAGVDVGQVQLDAERPTGTVNVSLEDGEPRFRIGERVAWERIELRDDLVPVLERAAAFCFGTLAQRTPLGCASLEQALTHVVGHRVLDLNLRPPQVDAALLERAIERATVIKLNEAEHALVAELLGANPVGALLGRGVELVALTRGARGAELFTRAGGASHPGFPLSSTEGDRVGAGDAFTAVLVTGLCRGTPLPALVVRANRYAAWVASCRGAMPAASAELRASVTDSS